MSATADPMGLRPCEADESDLESDFDTDSIQPTNTATLSTIQAWNLYVSHAFSTWNARGYEFAAILFTAAAYPDTLSAAALRMIIVYFAMVLFSTSVGSWVNDSPNRLRTLTSTILVNRGAVILASFAWLALLDQDGFVARHTLVKHFIFGVANCLGIIERLSASGNMISMERDWVVTAASPAGQPYGLTHLNAVMRRIDLVSKLISPIVISLVISSHDSTRLGIVYAALTNLISIPIEILSARTAWRRTEALRLPKLTAAERDEQTMSSGWDFSGLGSKFEHLLARYAFYFSTAVWIPSMSLAMLHFNMLTWRSTFITWLINANYSLNFITLARTVSSIFEIGSTVLTPMGVRYFGTELMYPRIEGDRDREENVAFIGEHEEQNGSRESNHVEDTLVGLQRTGLWGFTGQVINLLPVVIMLWVISQQIEDKETPARENKNAQQPRVDPSTWLSLVLFGFLSMSRLGVWVFDLTTQQLTQMMVEETSTFAGVENSIVNVFELAGAVAAISFPQTDQFKWLGLASFLLALVSWVMYAGWERVHRRRLLV